MMTSRMRFFRPILLVLVLPLCGANVAAQSAPATPDPARSAASAAAPAPAVASGSLYLVEFTVGPAWVKDKPPHEQIHFKEHSENLRRLRSEGRLVLGARYSDKGIVVLRASNEVEARAEVERDASVQAGVFRAAVFEFRPFYDGCVAKPGAPGGDR